MNYIVVIIPKFNFYKILFEEDFMKSDGKPHEFRTQNLIIETLVTLGLKREEFTCDLCSYRSLEGGK